MSSSEFPIYQRLTDFQYEFLINRINKYPRPTCLCHEEAVWQMDHCIACIPCEFDEDNNFNFIQAAIAWCSHCGTMRFTRLQSLGLKYTHDSKFEEGQDEQ